MASYDYFVPIEVREEIERQISQMRCMNYGFSAPLEFATVTDRYRGAYSVTDVYMVGWTEKGFWLGVFRVQSHLVTSGSPQTAETMVGAKALSPAPKNAWRVWDTRRQVGRFQNHNRNPFVATV